jgi:hypothetical protein
MRAVDHAQKEMKRSEHSVMGYGAESEDRAKSGDLG